MKIKSFLKVFLKKNSSAGKLIAMLWLSPFLLTAQTTFKVQTEKGYWSVFSASESLPKIFSQLNGKNILLNAKNEISGFHKIIDNLKITTQFKVVW